MTMTLEEAFKRHHDQVVLASYFPSAQDVYHRMAKMGMDTRTNHPAGNRGEIFYQANVDLLTVIKAEMISQDPTAFMDDWERAAYLKAEEKKEQDRWDTSPCPEIERAHLEGTEDADGIIERCLTKVGDWEQAAEVLERQDKMNSKWRRKPVMDEVAA